LQVIHKKSAVTAKVLYCMEESKGSVIMQFIDDYVEETDCVFWF